MEHKITTTYDKETLVDFKRFTLTKKSHLKPALLYILCIAVIVCAFIYNRSFELNFTTIIYPAIAIVSMIVVTLIYYVKPQSDNDKLEGKTVDYTFSEDCIMAGQLRFEFEDFYKIFEDRDYFYFFLSDSKGFIIDKDNVNFDMRGYLQEKISNPKKVLSLLNS